MPELYGFYLLLLAAGLAAAGYLWLLIAAFRQRTLWGVGVLLLPPLGLVFGLVYFRRALGAWLLLLASGLVAGGTVAASYYYTHHVDLGPREKIVDGERHITLTGWDGSDYSLLKTKTDVVVLQMANADVTDATLENLRGMTRLRELDLNDAAVTDAGLVILAELPALQELRLARTKITDEGFQKYLAARELLQRLDLTGTAIKGKTKRDWKNAQPGRRVLD